MNNLTKEQREAIRARSEAATSAPWKLGFEEGVQGPQDLVIWGNEFGLHLEDDDAIFIAHARQDIPVLLDALDEIESDCDHWKARAEALERAIATLPPTIQCNLCVYLQAYFCTAKIAGRCENFLEGADEHLWQFDEARFSKEG